MSNGLPDGTMLDVAMLHQRAERLLRDKGIEQWDKSLQISIGVLWISGTETRLMLHLNNARVYRCINYQDDVDVKFDASLIGKAIGLLDRAFILDRIADV